MEYFVLEKDSTLKDAIRMLDKNGRGFLAIVDKDNKLLGIITDGDIRRAILDNKEDIMSILNQQPHVMSKNDSRKYVISRLKELHRKHMPIVDENNILVDVVTLDDEEFNLIDNPIVIMAGGLGTRLGELTKNTPKPMLNVAGKPMLEYIIEMFTSHGFNNFILSVNYKATVVKEYFKDGREFGVNISYLEEKQRLGTGGSLSLLSKQDKPVIVINGDVLTTIDFSKLLKEHVQNESCATMCIRKQSYLVPYGVVEKDENGNLISITEKPEYSYMINAGIYVLSPEALNYIPVNKFFDLPKLFPILKNEGHKVMTKEIDSYWIDMGHPEDYEKINIRLNRI